MIGLFLVRSTNLSKFLSDISLTIHPADLIKTEPENAAPSGSNAAEDKTDALQNNAFMNVYRSAVRKFIVTSIPDTAQHLENTLASIPKDSGVPTDSGHKPKNAIDRLAPLSQALLSQTVSSKSIAGQDNSKKTEGALQGDLNGQSFLGLSMEKGAAEKEEGTETLFRI